LGDKVVDGVCCFSALALGVQKHWPGSELLRAFLEPLRDRRMKGNSMLAATKAIETS